MSTQHLLQIIEGFTFSLALIAAIGMQNAFVLRNGILRRHTVVIWLICAASDSILMFAGVLGLGALIGEVTGLATLLVIVGTAWVGGYGVLKLAAAVRGRYEEEVRQVSELAAQKTSTSLRNTAFVCIAVTWGNPHVYLDTVVLMGTISAPLDDDQRIYFASGAVLASWLFFAALSFGSRYLSPFFHSARAWRYLDCVIGLVMLALAAAIALH